MSTNTATPHQHDHIDHEHGHHHHHHHTDEHDHYDNDEEDPSPILRSSNAVTSQQLQKRKSHSVLLDHYHPELDDEYFNNNDSRSQHQQRRSVVRKLRYALIVISIFLLVELVGGYMAQSLAIWSDAAHLCADMAAIGIALLASHYATFPATSTHTFGYQRIESLAALFSTASLIVLSIGLAIEAIRRIILIVITGHDTNSSTSQSDPSSGIHTVNGRFMSIIAFIGVIVNVVLACILGENHVHLPSSDSGDCHHGHDHSHGHSHGHNHDEHHIDDHDNTKDVAQAVDCSDSSTHDHSLVHDHHNNVNSNSKNGVNCTDPHDHDHHHDHDHSTTTSNNNISSTEITPLLASSSSGQQQHNHDHDNDHHCRNHGSIEQKVTTTKTSSVAWWKNLPFIGTGFGNGTSEQHESNQNINLHAAYLHVLSDLLQSFAVFVAGCIIWMFPYLTIIDPICTLLFCTIVIYSSYPVCQTSIAILLQQTPSNINYHRLIDRMLQVPYVIDVHDLHIWSISHRVPALTVHVTISYPNGTTTVLAETEGITKPTIDDTTMKITSVHDTVLEQIYAIIRKEFNIVHATIQIQNVGGNSNSISNDPDENTICVTCVDRICRSCLLDNTGLVSADKPNHNNTVTETNVIV